MISGTITRAGVVNIDGLSKTGIFIECSGADIMRVHREGMFKKPVVIHKDRRIRERGKEVAFERVGEAQPGRIGCSVRSIDFERPQFPETTHA